MVSDPFIRYANHSNGSDAMKYSFNSVSYSGFIFIVIILTVLSYIPSVNAAVFTFSDDGSFASSDWSFSPSEFNGAGYFGTSQTQGNPSPSLVYQGSLSGIDGSYATFLAYNFNLFAPNTQRAINAIDMSIDVINRAPSPLQPLPFGFVQFGLAQDIDGDSLLDIFTLPIASADLVTGSWNRSSFTGLTASSFSDPQGRNPDLTGSGSEMAFLFIAGTPRLNYNATQAVNFDYGFDNWSVTLETTPVPAPASVWLFSFGLAGLIRLTLRNRG